ncbi:hypothetical protein DIPPA_18171 [Diplonema papillatum]|nr:hypothetical protein DIPPA_18171 [Diplonema papillatum]
MALVPLLALHCISAYQLQPLNIDAQRVVAAGWSHAADFSHQFHVAFSSMVSGVCVYSGQPYACAVTRFPQDGLVAQRPGSSVPRCTGCPPNATLVYDHCKNHPQWVDVGMLPDYVRRGCYEASGAVKSDCIDPPENLANASVYLFRGTHDSIYYPGSVANLQALYYQLLRDPAGSVKFVDDLPFPHCLPTNSTPFFNSTVPAMYDGPGECLRWTMPGLLAAKPMVPSSLRVFDQREFISSLRLAGTGVAPYGAVYIPSPCFNSGVARQCPLLVLPNGCVGAGDNASALFSGSDVVFAEYAEANGIVVLKPCVGGFVDAARFPNSLGRCRGASSMCTGS